MLFLAVLENKPVCFFDKAKWFGFGVRVRRTQVKALFERHF